MVNKYFIANVFRYFLIAHNVEFMKPRYLAHLITVDDRAVEDGRPVLHDIAVHGMLRELRKPLLCPLLA